MKKVLILEDEVSIRSFVVINLNRAGYEVIEAGTGMEALEKLKEHPDVGVAILDIMLPDIDGFEVCRNIRATDKKIGIIMLTARSQEMDKVTGLMTGADDYMTKPFSPAELTARIDALYRRIGSDTQSDSVELTQGPFVLNTRNRTLDKEGKRIKLTQVEYAIMKLFMQNPGRALSRGIKLKITKIDIPVSFSSAFEGEIIRKGDMQVEIDGSRKDCFELVTTKEASEVEDHKIIVEGPEIDEIPVGSKISMSYTVEVAGKAMQPDFEPVFERKIHQFLNCVEGLMHTGQRDMIRVRISKADYEAGFKFKHIGEVLYAKIKSEFDTVVDKCQVKIVVGDEPNAALRKHANEIFDKRDERLKSMTDESVPVFYSCIMCQAFSPSHVCIVTPERLGLCGAVSWLDAKATNELDPQGPCQVVTKERCIDERTGRYEDVDEAVAEYSHGALEHVTLYSLLEDPMTSCGCFECICGIEPVSMGVVITCREFAGMTPLGMTFSEMASMTGGGVQTPGFMGHGKHYIASHKFLKAEGGLARLVWLPSELKEQIRDKINETAKDLYGIENFADMVADETTCGSGDPEELLNFLTEKGHPVLSMEPFDM